MKVTLREHRRIRWLARSVCLFALALGGGAAWADAAAASCSPSNHCYAIDSWVPQAGAQYVGARADLSASRITGVTAGNFIDNEFWVVTDLSPVVAWVETGQTRGVVDGTWRDWGLFWAEWNTNNVYAEHFERTFTVNEIITQKIQYDTGLGKWGVYVNGNLKDYSTTHHGSLIADIDAGVESTTSSAGLRARIDQMQKQGAAWTWSFGWPGTMSNDLPTDIGWNTPWYDAWDLEN